MKFFQSFGFFANLLLKHLVDKLLESLEFVFPSRLSFVIICFYDYSRVTVIFICIHMSSYTHI